MTHRDDPGSGLPQAGPSDTTSVALILISPLAGAVAGFICTLFRMALETLDGWRIALIEAQYGSGLQGFLLVVALAATGPAIAALIVNRFARDAGGSGIPHVEAVLRGEREPSRIGLIPAKFIGGLLAIGSGLALGREGPSVQMGATVAHAIGRFFRLGWSDCRTLLAAGAGAGLATAFNAPMGGAIFVLEELDGRFEVRVAIAALAASASAIAVSNAINGSSPDFLVDAITAPQPAAILVYAILGGAAGLVAIAYNTTILKALDISDGATRLPMELRAAIIGAAVGAIAWFAPRIVGGGDSLTQGALFGHGGMLVLALLFVVRFFLGAASYAAGTPGGLFAPILVLGAQLGLLFGLAVDTLVPALGLDARGFALVGMAALFAGVVRAPLTGIALVIEMTRNSTMLLPVLAACFTAMLVPTLFGNAPIYEALGERSRRETEARDAQKSDSG